MEEYSFIKKYYNVHYFQSVCVCVCVRFTYKNYFFLQGERVISLKYIKDKLNLDIQMHTNIGYKEKNATSLALKAVNHW